MGKLKLKKLNRKGFTLIELLAVIVILAILILLAMPSVLSIMDNARKNAFETEVRSYLKAAQTKYAEKSASNTSSSPDMYFKTNGSDNDTCGDGSECKLDIENKNGYGYYIKIEMDENKELKYTYTVSNGTYEAEATGVSFSEAIKYDKNKDGKEPLHSSALDFASTSKD